MSYLLADQTGPLEEFASIGGLADFFAWAATQEEPVRSLGRFGFTEDLTTLGEVLSKATPPVTVQGQVDVLLEASKRAEGILIISDGMSSSDLRAAKSHAEGPLHAAADKKVASVSVAVRYAFATGRKALGRPPNVEKAVSAIQRALREVLPATLLKVVVAGGEVGLRQLQKLRAAELRTLDKYHELRFDAGDPHAVDWADRHAAELIDGISETSREDINNAIAQALEDGDLSAAYDKILAAVGDSARAELIARNEVMTAVSEGQRLAWDQAVDESLLTGDEKRVWIATDSGCPICEALDGELADLNGAYPGDGGDGPPAHVNCRCTEGIAELQALGGQGSGNFGHSGRPGQVGGSSSDGGPEAKERSAVSPEVARSIHQLTAQGLGDAAIAKRVGWHYSEGGRVRAARKDYDETGARRTAAPQPEQPPSPVPAPTPEPVAGPQVFESEHHERLAQVEQLRQTLRGDRVQVKLPYSTDPTTTIGQKNILTVHTALTQMVHSRQLMRDAGIKPPAVRLHFKPLGENTYANAWRNTINVNTRHDSWQGNAVMAKFMQRDFEAQRHPTAHPASILTHEMGHLLHQKETGNNTTYRFWQKEEYSTYDSVPRSVSRYAATNKLEFVAETFTGMVHGRSYSGDVMKEYTSLGGPKVPKRMRQ